MYLRAGEIHPHTTNPIESTFAHRAAPHQAHLGTRLPRGQAGDSVQAHQTAQARWRAVNSSHLVALVRAGARLVNDRLIERPDDQSATTTA